MFPSKKFFPYLDPSTYEYLDTDEVREAETEINLLFTGTNKSNATAIHEEYL